MQRYYIFFMLLMNPLRLCIVCSIKQKSKEKEYETGSDRYVCAAGMVLLLFFDSKRS